MFFKTNKLKKIAAGFLMLSVFVPSIFLAQPRQAHALFGDDATAVKEYILDLAATAFMKILINRITLRTVAWIRSGFDGEAFWPEQGLQGFFLDIANQVTGAFIDELGLGFLCGPWDFDIRFALVTRAPYRLEAECTLLDVATNAEAFVARFDEGAWLTPDPWRSHIHVSISRTNNPFDAFIQARGELAGRIANEEGSTARELSFGRGFLSHTKRECVEETPSGGCVRYEERVITPGSQIAGLSEGIITSPIRQAELADEINESLGIILGEFMNYLFTQGLSQTDLGSLGGSVQSSEDRFREQQVEISKSAISTRLTEAQTGLQAAENRLTGLAENTAESEIFVSPLSTAAARTGDASTQVTGALTALDSTDSDFESTLSPFLDDQSGAMDSIDTALALIEAVQNSNENGVCYEETGGGACDDSEWERLVEPLTDTVVPNLESARTLIAQSLSQTTAADSTAFDSESANAGETKEGVEDYTREVLEWILLGPSKVTLEFAKQFSKGFSLGGGGIGSGGVGGVTDLIVPGSSSILP